jgi:hypothetical protein
MPAMDMPLTVRLRTAAANKHIHADRGTDTSGQTLTSVQRVGCRATAELHDEAANKIYELETKLHSLTVLLTDIDAEFDRQLYDEDYVKSCRDNGLDIPLECEHHVIITEQLRRVISIAVTPQRTTNRTRNVS